MVALSTTMAFGLGSALVAAQTVPAGGAHGSPLAPLELGHANNALARHRARAHRAAEQARRLGRRATGEH